PVSVVSAQGLSRNFNAGLDLRLRPSRQIREIVRLLPESGAESGTIAFRGITAGIAAPGMLENVAALEIAAIGCLHERQILGKGGRVVAHMQPGHESRAAFATERFVLSTADPPRSKLDQLLVAHRIGGAGIAPC